MAPGDVAVQIVAADASAVDTALTAMRITAGANGKYLAVAVGLQNEEIMLIAITET